MECPLSEKELAVVKWLADGHTIEDIAEFEERTPSAIKIRSHRAKSKSGTATAAGLVAMALRRGWIK